MPLILNKEIDRQTRLGLWQINEETEELREQAELNPPEDAIYLSFRSETRKKQWLSYRILLKRMLPPDSVFLVYDDFGKPRLKDSGMHISVSHSGDYSAAIASKSIPVGIDIERLKDRIYRISDKFLSAAEDAHIGKDFRLEKLYVAWGAKEALYKIYGKPGVDFRRDLFIESFTYLCTGKGHCTARMNTPQGLEKYDIFYEERSGYMLVYALKTDLTK